MGIITRDLIAALAIAIVLCISITTRDGSVREMTAIKNEIELLNRHHEMQECKIADIYETIAPLQEIGPKMRYTLLGYFEITAYTNGSESIDIPRYRDGMTSTGTLARPGTCAVGKKRKIPKGTIIYIGEMGIYCRIEDYGPKVTGVDVFVSGPNDLKRARDIGRKLRPVYKVKRIR